MGPLDKTMPFGGDEATEEPPEERFHNRDNWMYNMPADVRFRGDQIWASEFVPIEDWTAKRAMAEIQKLEDKIPGGRFTLEIDHGYDGDTAELSFEGWRAATEPELHRRDVLRKWQKENIEREERKVYEALKEKFEGE